MTRTKNRKMGKYPLLWWTGRALSAIVCVSCLWTRSSSAADHAAKPEAEGLQLVELQLAREAAQKRAAELEAALGKTRTELEELRSRYAELYLRSQECSRQLEQLELQAGHLLVDRQALATGETAADALRTLEDVRKAQVALATKARAFKGYLSSVLDVLEPSDAMRREITTRCDELLSSAERTLKPLPGVAGRGRRDLEVGSCRVLAVNDDLQVVVLDSGHGAGVRRGTYWHLTRDDTVVARLRVIEVRTEISAAVVIDGHLSDIGPGSVLTVDRR